MEYTLLRAAYSSIVKEGLDASAGIFDKDGRNIAQAASIPIHLGCMIPAVEQVVANYSPDQIHPQDVFILNDPYAGGTHLPDIAIIRPVFFGEVLFGFTITMSHHQEVGGKTPGSLPTDATDLFQEGLQLPLMKIIDAGKPVSQVFSILERNVRTPKEVLGDLRAQLAACEVGVRKLEELNEDLTRAEIEDAIAALMRQSDILTRSRIQQMPDGIYSFTDYMDDDGVVRDVPIPIKATVAVKDDTISIDFDGTSPQVKGPFNCVPASTLAATYYVLRAVIGDDVPDNSGCYEALELKLPEGTIVNPYRPAPVNSRTATVRRIGDTLLGCFKQIIPEKVPAASCGQLLVMNFAGKSIEENGGYFVTSDLVVGGMGGRRGLDGLDAIETDATNCLNVPAETLELDAPIQVREWALTPDSAGTGKWRGGLGVTKTFAIQRDDVSVNYRGERHTTSPWGVEGGGEATPTTAHIIRASGTTEHLSGKDMLDLNNGDQLTVKLSGGGGYGDPLERDPEEVAADVRDGRVSVRAAKTLYGVVLTATNTVDEDATGRLRRLDAKVGES